MKKTLLCLAFSIYFLGHAACCYSQQWKQQVKLSIDVALNDLEHTLDGSEKIQYTNNSPDTLRFIWFHVWANAYKNDRTAYSEDLLNNDRTDFYFSSKDQKGYINRLDFKVDGITAKMEDHPEHIDIIKVILPEPLAPGEQVLISTPFHVQIPYNFTGNGHIKHKYQLAQWYAAPALYDATGWHPQPLTGQAGPAGKPNFLELTGIEGKFGISEQHTATRGWLNDTANFRSAVQPADYEVIIRVPSAYGLASAAGAPVDSSSMEGYRSLKYIQHNTTTFTWFATRTEPPVAKKPIKKLPARYQPKKKPLNQSTAKKKPAVKKTADQRATAGLAASQVTVKHQSNPLSNLFAKLFDTTKVTSISVLPAAGFNVYDGFMIGGILHNYLSEQKKFRFVAVPLYGTKSHELNGLIRVAYKEKLAGKVFKSAEVSLSVANFTRQTAVDSLGKKLNSRFSKLTPALKLSLLDDSSRRHEKWIGFKSHLITESNFVDYNVKSDDDRFYPGDVKNSFRYVNELTFVERTSRVLYPYDYKVQVQQAKNFYRLNLTGNYFLNYSKGGGAQVRVFAAKFGYINKQGDDFGISRYMPKLLANDGDDDYTYSDYFVGRTASFAFEDPIIKNGGVAAQQVMLRDGGFKIRPDQLTYLQGRSDNWVASMNITTTLPYKIIPKALPLKLYLDLGTQAESWSDASEADRFVFDAGVQLSLFHDVLTIYVPVVYSKIFKEYFNSFNENKFLKTITFSIDMRRIKPAAGYKKFFDL